MFCTIYDTFFPINKMKMKTKNLEIPWTTQGIKKSKMKQRLYSKLNKKEMKKRKKNMKITKSFLNLLRSGQINQIFLN